MAHGRYLLLEAEAHGLDKRGLVVGLNEVRVHECAERVTHDVTARDDWGSIRLFHGSLLSRPVARSVDGIRKAIDV
jgi:hypothetical protein